MAKNHKKIAIGFLLLTIISIVFLTGSHVNVYTPYEKIIESENKITALNIASDTKYIFLSDLNYITENNWSYNGWEGHTITTDKNQNNGSISLFVDGEIRTFVKGVAIHARGQATYDISEYSNKFSRFIAYLGVDASMKPNGNLWIQILASKDGAKWDSLHKTSNMTASSNAVEVDLDIKGYKYLRIYVDPVGANTADHGTIANARFVTEDFDKNVPPFPEIHQLEYYDEILSPHDAQYNMENNYKLILEREIVNRFGYWTIQNLAEVSKDAKDALNWMFERDERLEQLIEVGPVNAAKFLEDFILLYSKHKADLYENNGYVYQKIMIALSAAHSTDILLSPLRFGAYNSYNVLTRYELLKDSFDNNKFKKVTTNALTGTLVDNDWFKDYSIPLMRTVVHEPASDIDFNWLNGYSHDKIAFNFWVVPYISPNYGQARFYDELNRDMYTEKYLLDKYNVPYGTNSGQHYWMVIAGGGICWNQSRFGQALYRVNGIPAVGAYRPGHEFFFNYYQDENGKGYWTGRYGGWSGTGTTWGGAARVRYPLDWANKYFTTQTISGSNSASSSGYLYLAQANLNEYEKYKESLYYNLASNSYIDNSKKLETYLKSLEINELNLDTYDYIISLYKKMNTEGTITADDWYNLSLQIIDVYTYYPVAMYDLLKLTRPYLEGADKLDIDRLEKDALNKATHATSDLTNSAEGAREHANWLLGKTQADPMTFSFDGENGGKIVRNPNYQIAWGYSLDGGVTFTNQVNEDSITLTRDELESITAENDIIISFMGLADYRFRIDITKGTIPNNVLYGNDLENRVIGVNLSYEWRNSETENWTSYADASPNNIGNKTLYVRLGATGHQLPSDSRTFTFTEDNQPDTEKYIPIRHLSVAGYSTQSKDSNRPFYAPNAIDGNLYTMWHTDFAINVLNPPTRPFHIIKLDEKKYISALEFVQTKYKTGDPDYIKNVFVYVSEDGENWTLAGTLENCPRNGDFKKVTFDESIYGQYVKFEVDTYDMFASAAMINLFEDTTKIPPSPAPTANVGYSITTPTNNNVVARLVNSSTDIKIINNNGSESYTFTKNGEFTFEFIDKNCTENCSIGRVKAKVDWIDRTAPTATIEYNTQNKTNKTVVAVLKPSEEIIVTSKSDYSVDEDGNVLDINGNILNAYVVDNDGNIKDPNGEIVANIHEITHAFHDNDEFIFEFKDLAGNKGTATAKVDWIDRTIPTATLKYDITSKTNKDVTVTIIFNESDVEVTNNDGRKSYTFTKNGEFTFEFKDAAGNTNKITARVDWMDKVAPTAELKYDKSSNKKAIVKVVNPSEEITFKEGNGTYEFTKNGVYSIIIYDKVGNMKTLRAVIDWLQEEKPSKPDNKPNNDTSSGDDNGEISNKPNDSIDDDSEDNTNTETNYYPYSTGNITVKISENVMTKSITLKQNNMSMNSIIADDRFGSASEYFELYFTNSMQDRVVLETSMKMIFKLNQKKEFLGIYEMTEDSLVKPLKYQKNDDTVEFETDHLGKYVISYKEKVIEEIPSQPEETPNQPEETDFVKSNNTIVWFIIGGSVIGAIGVVVFIFKRQR